MKRNLPLKVVLSVWIIYNVLTLVIMPNAGSFIGRKYGHWFASYASSVGLNASWNFFSPDPAHTLYIKYYVEFRNEDGDSLRDPVVGYFPAEKNQGVMDINRRRELYVMRFMIIGTNRMQALFVPWLCKQHPGATSVQIEQVIETVAPLDEVVTLSQSPIQDLSKEIQYSRFNMRCDSPLEDYPL